MNMEDTEGNSLSRLSWLDYLVIVAYFIIILFVGLYSSYSSKRSSVKGYFLASKNMHWVPVGASIFASNIGSGHFIGLAGSGAASGIGVAAYELSAVFTLMVLGWVFVPVYMVSEVFTMPEYLRLRFGGQRIRVYLAVLALLLYVFTKISADLYAGALFIQAALGFKGDEGLYTSIFLLLAISAIFTVTGGLTAVIWTDFVQTILMMFGASVLMILSFNAVGGYKELIRKYMLLNIFWNNGTESDDLGNNTYCGAVPSYAMHLIRSVDSGNSDLPWTGLLFGLPFTSMWYFCSDQVIVQRALSSKNMSHAKGGCILAGYLKLTPIFLLVLPGMASRVLYTDRVACTDPNICYNICGSPTGCTNIAYAELVIRLMPVGLSGMMLAVMMAALMSSLTSIFNSSSTIFTIDIWTRLRKKPSDAELLIVGRSFVLVLLVISVLWVPILKELKASQLFVYIQQVQNFLSPPITAVYLMAIFIPRTNEVGAFWGLMVGLLFGLLKFVLEFAYTAPLCGSADLDIRPLWIKTIAEIHYLHFAAILFVITFCVTCFISFMTEPIQADKLDRLTFWTRHSTRIRKPIDEQQEEINNAAHEDYNISQAGAKVNCRITMRPRLSNWRKMCNFVCGLSNGDKNVDLEPHPLPAEEAVAAANFLYETPSCYRFVNGNAILLLCFTISIWIFYA